ncbi:MAG: M4 family metallopeptidase, partial [Saprospiraceae bacterium]|nr:M4 family metallopeptidase [Saprospiraceae bacterium]
MKKILLLLVVSTISGAIFAQHGKPAPQFKTGKPSEKPSLNWPGKSAVPAAENPFNLPTEKRRPIGQFTGKAPVVNLTITHGENGLPILIEGQTPASVSNAEQQTAAMIAVAYLASLEPQGLQTPADEFVVRNVQVDEQGNHHVRMDQYFQGIPVWGGELIAHSRNGAFDRVNGRYFPTPKLASTTPALDGAQAQAAVIAALGQQTVKTTWTDDDLRLIDGPPFSAELVIYHVNDDLNNERLVWHVVAHPSILSRLVYFIDAQTGAILNHYDNTCNLTGHRHASSACTQAHNENTEPPAVDKVSVDGPVTIQGQDLFNINRSFPNGGWQVGSQVVMEDASKSMFNAGASTMPNDPVGAIVTLDALNTSPQNNNFDYNFVVSASTTFTNKKAAISAHYNAGLSFDYFKSKFNRNSIDGVGGNILAFVNVADEDGSSMENAFWNGEAMWYGNGGSTFKPLARGLDVGGHEMTHGVVEKTANLVYQNESGALNESFADIFGAMIDSDDWKIGEDVMQSGVNPTNCLRDLSNPHNGVSSNSPWWQPNHTNEQYTGSAD